MRREAIVLMACVLGSCGGVVEARRPRVVIDYARVVDEGRFVRALVVARVEAAADRGASFAWTIGVVPTNRSVCREARGWRMDHANDTFTLEPGEARELRIRATSGVRALCVDPTFARLARCGEPVTLVLAAASDDEASATYETTFDCAIEALQP